MEKPIRRHNSVIFNYFALIITDFQLFALSLPQIGVTSAIKQKKNGFFLFIAFGLHYLCRR